MINLIPLYKARDFGVFSAKWFYPLEGEVIGKHLDRTVPHDWLVAIEWAGIIPYFTHQPVLDTLGLNDRDVLTNSNIILKQGHRTPLAYLDQREPQIVVPCVRTFNTATEALNSTRILHDSAGKKVKGVCRYWNYTNLVSEKYDYSVCVIEVSKNSYWPALIRHGVSREVLHCVNL